MELLNTTGLRRQQVALHLASYGPVRDANIVASCRIGLHGSYERRRLHSICSCCTIGSNTGSDRVWASRISGEQDGKTTDSVLHTDGVLDARYSSRDTLIIETTVYLYPMCPIGQIHSTTTGVGASNPVYVYTIWKYTTTTSVFGDRVMMSDHGVHLCPLDAIVVLSDLTPGCPCS